MKRLLSLEPVAVGAFGFSLACHAVAVLEIASQRGPEGAPFADEMTALVLLALALSAASLAVRRHGVFVALHAVRMMAIWLLARIQATPRYTIELAVMLPFVLEGSLYGGVRFGAASGPALIALVAVAQALGATGGISAPLALFAFSGVLAGSLIVLYREQLVDSRRRVGELEAAVTNLSAANREFQAYSQGLESKSASAERSRITRELHDTVGYALTNIIVMMDAAKVMAATGGGGLARLLEDARTHAEDALQETREILYRLRSLREVPLEGLRAIAQLVRAFKAATGVSVRLNYGNVPFSFGRDIDAAVYRLVQEGLTNAFRHGRATEVTVNLWRHEAEITLTLRDNGQGAADAAADGIGLAGMRERLAALGGTLRASNVEGGFELRAAIPFRTVGAA